jgi:hypothetical protein
MCGRWVQQVRANPAVIEFRADGTGRYSDPLQFDRPSVQTFRWKTDGRDLTMDFDVPKREVIGHTVFMDDGKNMLRFTVKAIQVESTGDRTLLRFDVPLDWEAAVNLDPEWCQCDPDELKKMHGWYQDVDEYDHRVTWTRVGSLSQFGL